ncbi:indole-3-glycerol-phosphate synthase [Candidatus Peregrinibacteria bacterium]|nr:indole-3-glycerol-phosphate synthase [Candidatus Peregrinibacteria bacterium]
MNFLKKVTRKYMERKAEGISHARFCTFKIEINGPKRDFYAIIQGKETLSLIAEIKRASPSKGRFPIQYSPSELAKIYEQNGAHAISVVTEERFFCGTLPMLKEVRNSTSLPVLRKDFLLTPHDLYESKFFNADAVLIIAKLFSPKKLKEIVKTAREMHLQPLIEIHDREDLNNALPLNPRAIGINARDLRTLILRKERIFELLPFIPKDTIIVAESGIQSSEDMKRLQGLVDAVLVGEAIVTAKRPDEAIRGLLSVNGISRYAKKTQ